VIQDLRVLRVLLDLKGMKVPRDLLEQWDHRDFRVLKVPRVNRDSRVLKEMRVFREHRDLKGLKVFLEQKVRKD
jgi:hypothetical protein